MAKSPAPPPIVPDPDEEMIDVALDDANHAQLMWFSRLRNLDVDEMETLSQTLTRLKAAWDHPTISVPRVIEPETKPKAPLEFVVSAEDRCGLPEFVDVIIQGDGIGESDDLLMAHNGITFRAKVGERVTLPWYVYKGCLDDAKEIRYTHGRDSGLGQPIERHAIQFTRVK